MLSDEPLSAKKIPHALDHKYKLTAEQPITLTWPLVNDLHRESIQGGYFVESEIEIKRYSVEFIEAHAEHKELGYSIDICVPANARHRPAVKRFLKGRYYEPFSHVSFTRILNYKGNASAVHAGAFFGDMLHTYSKVAKTVYAFEPVLANYVLAKSNLERMSLTNVVLMNAGLSDRSDLAFIKTTNEHGRFAGGSSALISAEQTVRSTFEVVPVFRLDDLPIDGVGLLQLDIEDHELQALHGAVKLISRCRPVILVEDNKAGCADFLRGHGYEFCFKSSGLNYWALPEDFIFVSSLRT